MRGDRRPAEILVVEDIPADIELIHEALQTVRAESRVSVTTDCEAALAFLRREGGYEDAPHPDLILLDLCLPGKDGFEVLQAVRKHPALTRVPVIVLSSSQADGDILRSYALRANCYIVKPVDVEEFLQTTAPRASSGYRSRLFRPPEGRSRAPGSCPPVDRSRFGKPVGEIAAETPFKRADRQHLK